MIGNVNLQDPFAHGAYLVWDGGTLKFDVVDEEDVTRDADIVEHPVETGAAIADHYRIRLNDVKLTAFISQEPIDPSIYPDAQGSVQSFELVLPQYPQISAASTIASAALGGGIPGQVTQALAQTPPTRFTQRGLVYANPIDTLATVLGVLEDLRANATVVDVATRSWYYASTMLGQITTKRNEKTGSGAIIEIALRQVVFVSTDAVALPPTPKKPKDKPLGDKGKQNGTPPQLESGAIGLLKLAGVL